MRYLIWLFLAGMTLASCTDVAPRNGGDILVLGDSVLAWNGSRNASIPDVMGQALSRQVVNKAVPGAQFDNASTLAGAVGFDIKRQFQAGSWNWVVLNGGANDLAADCGCGDCRTTVNRLIAPDAQSGSIPDFIRMVQARSGAEVLWMGYYAGSGAGSFAGCRDDLVELEKRLSHFADATPRVTFADSEDVIDRKDRSLFASDNTHPSVRGSALIGNFLAAEISRRDPRSQIGR